MARDSGSGKLLCKGRVFDNKKNYAHELCGTIILFLYKKKTLR
jgi:hypothetical protein